MQRRYLGLTSAVAALGMTLAVSGCGGEGVGSGDVTLTLIAAEYGGENPSTSSDIFWSKMAEDFEAEHPGITISVDVLPWKVVDSTVAKRVEEGKAPDMAQIGAYSDFAAAGELYSADELLSIPTQADFLPQFAQAGEVNRVQYGMPYAASTRMFFYNKKLFRDAGLEPPTTWADLKAAAQALKAQGVEYPVALPFGTEEEAQAETLLWTLAGGGGYTDETDSYSIASRQNVKTLEWLRDNLVAPGLAGPVPVNELERAEAFKAFTQGKVGMLNGHPTLVKDAESNGVEVGKIPVPGPEGTPDSTMGVADWMMAFKQNGHREEIGQFLDFVYSTKNVKAFCARYDILPVTTSAFDDMSADPKHKNLDAFLKALPTVESYPMGKTTWPSVSAAIKKEIGKAVMPGGDPESILGRIERDATATENAE